ncbi:hypothetical protein COS81_04215 [candidate division WWE3 bacterium CG06_land_8_20_14_3_00_42_16]|uniref:Phosphatidylglycerol--prolipoprotein diacylglyceryl transferase n=4 Tax=Katanobacteria TaxID=422282 RepID=A0A2M7ALX5_UNCKA|nr:MAG: hypothetical protein AUJ38_01485 [bacterium CG1_02_42_9]PIU68392.1 MAG: hypothetical protein COS81_04215 [candidate division WWE3 bacterium CG06_land_8_20_14_3_00_42_16]PIZ42921.1 MAG: hypothetical protein COY34_01970 [candidate division WWE3 bacterium CG_4_10_14_0_2_um_filter_42_8]PJA37471.1 MAG: hypothetical protein CO181_03365 [candidate division WWE3 bacterium CG_4_9_14_3_um_filter_43_9]PJC68367.1 MAG: hypothetical protein CO015_04290 [candidate division WWE3 bacterium CG_4_8_14_3_u
MGVFMQPIFFQLGSVKIYTLSIFLSLAFLSATLVVWREGRRRNFEEEKILDLVVLMVLGGIVLGRIVFFLLNRSLFSSVLDFFLFWKVAGVSFFGGVCGAILAAMAYIRHHHWPMGLIFDILMLGILLGLGIYRIGFFSSGNGFGTVTNSILGVIFLGIPEKRHPISLYEAVFFLFAFIVLYVFWRKKTIQKGTIFSLGLATVGVLKSLLYFLEDITLMKNPNLTLISRLSIMVLGSLFLYYFSERKIKLDFGLIVRLKQKFSNLLLKKGKSRDGEDKNRSSQNYSATQKS